MKNTMFAALLLLASCGKNLPIILGGNNAPASTEAEQTELEKLLAKLIGNTFTSACEDNYGFLGDVSADGEQLSLMFIDESTYAIDVSYRNTSDCSGPAGLVLRILGSYTLDEALVLTLSPEQTSLKSDDINYVNLLNAFHVSGATDWAVGVFKEIDAIALGFEYALTGSTQTLSVENGVLVFQVITLVQE